MYKGKRRGVDRGCWGGEWEKELATLGGLGYKM